jgi:hypothetical protein
MLSQKNLFFCFFLWCCHTAMTQQVIATSGMFGTHATGSLSITIGEIITETELNSSGILTQGFQQNYESILALPENEIEAILLYPMYDLNFRLIDRQLLKDCSPCQMEISKNAASEYLIYHLRPGKQPRFVGTLIHILP